MQPHAAGHGSRAPGRGAHIAEVASQGLGPAEGGRGGHGRVGGGHRRQSDATGVVGWHPLLQAGVVGIRARLCSRLATHSLAVTGSSTDCVPNGASQPGQASCPARLAGCARHRARTRRWWRSWLRRLSRPAIDWLRRAICTASGASRPWPLMAPASRLLGAAGRAGGLGRGAGGREPLQRWGLGARQAGPQPQPQQRLSVRPGARRPAPGAPAAAAGAGAAVVGEVVGAGAGGRGW